MEQLFEKCKAYEAWVSQNPNLVRDLETAAKWTSFAIGRASNSNIMSELAYSISNLMVFYHDRIIVQSKHTSAKHKVRPHDRIIKHFKVILTTINHCEVFLELLCKRLHGNRGKWLCITLIQLTKCTARCVLLYLSKEMIMCSPPLPFTNRRNLEIEAKKNVTFLDGNSLEFQLKRSGRIIRKVEGAPPLQYRDLELFKSSVLKPTNDATTNLLYGELVYITKPFLHLISLYLSGSSKHWKPYYLALGMDILSLSSIYQNRRHLNKTERLEMSGRCVRLVLYLMRTPFYEEKTQRRLDSILDACTNIPLLNLLKDAIQSYIPFWQQTYFYLWSV